MSMMKIIDMIMIMTMMVVEEIKYIGCKEVVILVNHPFQENFNKAEFNNRNIQ